MLPCPPPLSTLWFVAAKWTVMSDLDKQVYIERAAQRNAELFSEYARKPKVWGLGYHGSRRNTNTKVSLALEVIKASRTKVLWVSTTLGLMIALGVNRTPREENYLDIVDSTHSIPSKLVGHTY